MNKKTKKTLIVIVSVIVVSITFGIGFFVGRNSYSDDINTVNYILSMYKKYYYEETDDLVGTIEGALFDKYSEYYDKEEYDLVKKTALGEREGVGFSYNRVTGEITQVLGNSPAKKAGIKEGSSIVAIGNTEDSLTNIDETNTVETLLSSIPANQDFAMQVSFNGTLQTFVLQKQKYVQTNVSYYDETGEYGFTSDGGKMTFKMLDGNTDYDFSENKDTAIIRYSGFSGLTNTIEGSAKQIEGALEFFKSSKKSKLILDLRNNGGGYMSILEDVSSHFIDCETGSVNLISYAKYKDGKKETYYSKSVDYASYGFQKIVVLANENTASASEALIGAMLDYDKNNKLTVIVEKSVGENGEALYKTYGKGIMQTTYQRLNGSAIKLTTAKIFWPVSDISIHGVGVTVKTDKRVVNETENGAVYDALKLCR